MTDAPFRAAHPEKLVVNFNKNLESSGKYRDSFYSVGFATLSQAFLSSFD